MTGTKVEPLGSFKIREEFGFVVALPRSALVEHLNGREFNKTNAAHAGVVWALIDALLDLVVFRAEAAGLEVEGDVKVLITDAHADYFIRNALAVVCSARVLRTKDAMDHYTWDNAAILTPINDAVWPGNDAIMRRG